MNTDQTARQAVGHRRRRRTTGHWEVAGLPGAGALRSTATDVLTFLHAQLRQDDTPLGPAIALIHLERRPGERLGAPPDAHDGGGEGHGAVSSVRCESPTTCRSPPPQTERSLHSRPPGQDGGPVQRGGLADPEAAGVEG